MELAYVVRLDTNGGGSMDVYQIDLRGETKIITGDVQFKHDKLNDVLSNMPPSIAKLVSLLVLTETAGEILKTAEHEILKQMDNFTVKEKTSVKKAIRTLGYEIDRNDSGEPVGISPQGIEDYFPKFDTLEKLSSFMSRYDAALQECMRSVPLWQIMSEHDKHSCIMNEMRRMNYPNN